MSVAAHIVEFAQQEDKLKELLDVITKYAEDLVKARVPVEEFASTIRDALASLGETSTATEVVGFLIDALWYEDIKATAVPSENSSVARKSLLAAVSALLETSIITPEQVKEKLEPDFVEALDLTRSNIPWSKKIIRFNTALFYKQQKFNLLREESEGYAKLITEIQQRVNSDPTDENITHILGIVNSLIGFFDLDPNRVLDILLDLFSENVLRSSELFLKLFRASNWYRSITPTKNIFASLMGYKFQYNQMKKNGEVHHTLNIAVAILIKTGFMSLGQIYPYLSPDDSKIDSEYNEFVKYCRKKARNVGGTNLLASSVLGGDDSAGNGDTPTPEPIKPTDQKKGVCSKATLCEALFSVGDMNSALMILARWPTLARIDSQIVVHFARCIHYIIEPLFRKCNVYTGETISRHQNSMDIDDPMPDPFNPSSVIGGVSRLISNWEQNLTQLHEFSEFLPTILPYLELMGPALATDITLATKICRITKNQLIDNASWLSVDVKKKYMDLYSTYLIPVVSLCDTNLGFVMEMWNIMKTFPYATRYTLYGAWRSSYEEYPELFIPKASSLLETKGILRRISKENVKQFGRKLSKIGNSNPLICFATLLDQIQAYENLIVPLVDCLRYLTDFAFDVLAFVLIEALANPEKQRLKPDGTNISLWLNSLAVFSGYLFKRHSNVELTGLLHYILYQGKDGNSLDLVVLKELVTKMSGIEQMSEGYSDQQLEALAGGETLKVEAVNPGGSSYVKKSSERLLKALLDSDLVFQFAILIAKQRNSCVFHTEINHVKLLSSLFDQVQETLLQYVDFVCRNLDDATFFKLCPNIENIVNEYGVDSEAAWFIARMKLKLQDTHVVVPDVEKMEVDYGDDTTSPMQYHVGGSLPAKAAEYLGSQFYSLFWELTLYDIYVPTERYRYEILKHKQQVATLDLVKELDAKAKKEQTRLTTLISKLETELSTQEEAVSNTLERLRLEKDAWFANCKNRKDLIDVMLQHCIRPRCLFSANDATFCAKFIMLLHALGTLELSTLSLINRIIYDVGCITFMCSQNEAGYYGRFLCELLSTLHRWHSSEEIYNAEVISNFLPGFKRSWKSQTPVDSPSTAEDLLTYEAFREVLFKWHTRLYKGFASCLQSKEYMKMRNSIVILDKISDYFPAVKDTSQSLEKKVQHSLKIEKREDLKVLLTRYDTTLKKNRNRLVSRERFFTPPNGEVTTSPKKDMDVKREAQKPEEEITQTKEATKEIVEPIVEKEISTIETNPVSQEKKKSPRKSEPINGKDTKKEGSELKGEPSKESNPQKPANGGSIIDEARALREKLQAEAVKKREQNSPQNKKDANEKSSPAKSEGKAPSGNAEKTEDTSERPQKSAKEDIAESARSLERDRRYNDRDRGGRWNDNRDNARDSRDNRDNKYQNDYRDNNNWNRNDRIDRDRRDRDTRDLRGPKDSRVDSRDTRDNRADAREINRNDRDFRPRDNRVDNRNPREDNRRDGVQGEWSRPNTPQGRRSSRVESESPNSKRQLDYDGTDSRRSSRDDSSVKRRKFDERDDKRREDIRERRPQKDTYIPSYSSTTNTNGNHQDDSNAKEDDSRRRRNVQIPAALTANLNKVADDRRRK